VYEAGRTLRDAVSEVREAVDFCRYYAFRAEQEFTSAMVLPWPTGERNELQLHGRGVFACISPWNFPLAIFIGQIAAALAAGNTVLAKPARQTPLTGYQAIRLMYEAGVPEDILHFLPGSGAVTGRQLCADQRLGGVAFTGSTDTAWDIQRALADRRGPILHVIRYQGARLDKVIEAVNATGYGLTLGVHSRVETTWKQVQASARVGNLYINRNMIGAVVGAQPFGGEGLSGTGPKAGGPYYLHRFATERTLSVNTAAVGGNTGLLSMRGD